MSDTKLIVGSVVFSSGLPLGGEGAMYAAGQPARDLAAAKTEIATLRAALAERQAAIDALCVMDDLDRALAPVNTYTKALQNRPAWIAIRALATKEPQS